MLKRELSEKPFKFCPLEPPGWEQAWAHWEWPVLTQGLQKGERSSPVGKCTMTLQLGSLPGYLQKVPGKHSTGKRDSSKHLWGPRAWGHPVTMNSHKAFMTFISPSLPCSYTVRVRNLRANREEGEGRAREKTYASPHRPHPTTVPLAHCYTVLWPPLG